MPILATSRHFVFILETAFAMARRRPPDGAGARRPKRNFAGPHPGGALPLPGAASGARQGTMCSKAQGDAVRHETIRFTQLLFASSLIPK